MLKNSAMFENTDERRKSWKYHKIFSHGAFDFWRYHKIASNGEKFNLFNLKPPTHGNVWKYHKIAGHGPNILHNLKTQQNILPYLKIQQDFQPRGHIWIIEDTKYVTMFENTTRLQATGKSLSCWSHPMISIFEGPQNCQQPRKFNLLKPPKRQCSTGKNLSSSIWSHPQGNVWKYHKIAGNGPNILQDLRTQQDFQQPGHLSHWSNHICGNVWKYHKIAAHAREKFKVLKPPKITKYVAMSENTTRWQATGENLTYWSNQIRGNAWKYRTIPGHKIVSNGKTLNLLKTSDMWQCWKIAQCLKIPTKDVSHGNTTRFSATELSIFEGTTRLPATEKNLTYSIWNHQHTAMFENTTRLQATDPIFCTIWKHNKIFCHIWKYNKIFSREETFELLKTPNMWQCSRIPQDCRPRGKA